MHEELITIKELAVMVRVSVQTVYRWRAEGSGPRSIVAGRSVRYRASDVRRWLDGRRAEEDEDV